jgi:UDP-N-acetylmuramate dehydrogenase
VERDRLMADVGALAFDRFDEPTREHRGVVKCADGGHTVQRRGVRGGFHPPVGRLGRDGVQRGPVPRLGRVRAADEGHLQPVPPAAVQAGLSGLETLVDVPGTVGGALVGNAGGHGGDIGERVADVMVMLADGTTEVRDRSRLAFESRWSNLDDCLIIGCRLELDEEDPTALTKRMQKQWIVGRSTQPGGTRTVAMMFKDPLGTTAESLIAQSGARDLRAGDASVYAPHANYVMAGPHCSSDDVRTLVETVRSRVREKLGVELTPQIEVW